MFQNIALDQKTMICINEFHSSYFGPRNSLPVVDILTRAGFDNATVEHAAYTIDYFARMPYSNNWRVNPREGRAIVANCPGCTVPARSGNKAMAIADTLNKQWGVQVRLDAPFCIKKAKKCQ